jgi:hypothetical protein
MESARNSSTSREQGLRRDGETNFQCIISQDVFVTHLSIDDAEHQCVNVDSHFVPVLQTPYSQFCQYQKKCPKPSASLTEVISLLNFKI